MYHDNNDNLSVFSIFVLKKNFYQRILVLNLI